MKKPDKVYVHVGAHLGLLTLTIIPTDAPEEEEYIRKDALIELIKEESKFWDEGEMIFRGLIDKLNEM